jgi:hypothetical protein
MAIMFSKVTMRDDYNESEFFVGGFPQDADDLEGWTAYHEFLDEITEDTVVNVRAQAFLYGEGETVTATPEEVAYMMMRMNWDPEFLGDHCDNIGDRDFVIDWDGDEVFGYDWP